MPRVTRRGNVGIRRINNCLWPMGVGMENSKKQRHKDRRLDAARRNDEDRRASGREMPDRRAESYRRSENERRADSSRDHQDVDTD